MSNNANSAFIGPMWTPISQIISQNFTYPCTINVFNLCIFILEQQCIHTDGVSCEGVLKLQLTTSIWASSVHYALRKDDEKRWKELDGKN